MKYFTLLLSLLAVASASTYSERAVEPPAKPPATTPATSPAKPPAKPVTSPAKPPVKPAKTNPLEKNLKRDAETLRAFAKTVKVDPHHLLKTWVGEDPCEFKGIFCDRRPDGQKAVSGVDFNNAHLGVGLSLHNLIEKLTDIVLFHANSNRFAGGIPNLSSKWLYEIDLSNNNLTGPFPTGVLGATELTLLDLRFNNLEGPLPAGVFTKIRPDVLWLNNNKFTGTIPNEVGQSQVKYLTLANNGFSGPVPASLAKMKNLEEGIFLNNALTGGIPEGLCAKKGITFLDFRKNKLTVPLGPACTALKKANKLLV